MSRGLGDVYKRQARIPFPRTTQNRPKYAICFGLLWVLFYAAGSAMINTTLTSQIIKTISVSMKTDRIKPCGAAMRRQRHLYGLMFFVYFATVPKFFPLLYRNIYCIWLIYPSDSQPGQILYHWFLISSMPRAVQIFYLLLDYFGHCIIFATAL